MSAIVSDIVTQAKALIATTLGATYRELKFVYDVSKNDDRSAKLGYGVRALGAETSETVNRSYTMDHGIEIILTDSIVRAGNSDLGIADSIATMFNKADEIFKVLVQTKLNLSSTVLNIFEPSLSEPEVLDAVNVVVLRMRVLVKYRSALT